MISIAPTVAALIFIFPLSLSAQERSSADSLSPRLLDSVEVHAYLMLTRARPLGEADRHALYSGKNSVGIRPDGDRSNLAANVSRQAFAQIPGLNLWDMDGAGTQLNIGNRGTDAHRSIEMNMRQNGYVVNSDLFGYPEAHYTPPLQGVQQIQFVRGAAALQFGSQFGGMMNFIMKTGDSSKPFSIESEQTAGSNGFFNSFNSVGGTSGKWNYYAYYDNRHGDGWRPNARFNYHAYHAGIGYQISSKANLRLEYSRMDYVQQIAGGLTDAQYSANSKQSFRARNFFNPEINLPAAIFRYEFSPSSSLEITSHFLVGQRNSVQFINTSNIPDTVNPALGNYNPRQVDRDYYNGFTTEARFISRYSLGAVSSTLSAGLRYSIEKTKREQKGLGTDAGDFDLTLTKAYGIDLHFRTRNYAAYAENRFGITPRLSVTPGVRVEVIRSSLEGLINDAAFPVNYQKERSFPLFGLGAEYQVSRKTQLFGNVSQAYRPYLYANITPADQIGRIDPDLKDSRGYDVDFGYRGQAGDVLQFSVNAFYVYYGDRAGQLTLTNPDNSVYLYTTNIGNAISKGVEAYGDLSLSRLFGGGVVSDLRLFSSLSYTRARYVTGTVSISGKNIDLEGHHLENAPEWISRNGLQFFYRHLTTSLQYSYTSGSFSDANNTNINPTGATGVVPSYHVWDWSASWRFARYYHLSAGINNVANARYFTRRINMYPGPGILPADGRSFYVSLGLKL